MSFLVSIYYSNEQDAESEKWENVFQIQERDRFISHVQKIMEELAALE
jgi:hypothetical protein